MDNTINSFFQIVPVAYASNPKLEMDNSVLWNNKAVLGTNLLIPNLNSSKDNNGYETEGFSFVKNKDETDLNTENFKIKGHYLIMSQMPLPKNSKVYMEIEITKQPKIDDIRHLGISLGVHKIPERGILADDFCMGNIYYTKPHPHITQKIDYLDYYVTEKASSDTYKFVTPVRKESKEEINDNGNIIKLWQRPEMPPPGLNKTIGMAIDTSNGIISFYVNGEHFYSFYSTLVKNENDKENDESNNNIGIVNTTNIYFAMYSIFSNIEMEGMFNLGRNTLKYTPSGYLSLYDAYNYQFYYPVFTIDFKTNIINADKPPRDEIDRSETRPQKYQDAIDELNNPINTNKEETLKKIENLPAYIPDSHCKFDYIPKQENNSEYIPYNVTKDENGKEKIERELKLIFNNEGYLTVLLDSKTNKLVKVNGILSDEDLDENILKIFKKIGEYSYLWVDKATNKVKYTQDEFEKLPVNKQEDLKSTAYQIPTGMYMNVFIDKNSTENSKPIKNLVELKNEINLSDKQRVRELQDNMIVMYIGKTFYLEEEKYSYTYEENPETHEYNVVKYVVDVVPVINNSAFYFYNRAYPSINLGSNIKLESDLAFINFPIPVFPEVYFEFKCMYGYLSSNYAGIPVRIGITNKIYKTDRDVYIDNTSDWFKIDLFRQKASSAENNYMGEGFKTCGYINGTGINSSSRTINGNIKLKNPFLIEQGKNIGVRINLRENKIILYVRNYEFGTVDIPEDLKFNFNFKKSTTINGEEQILYTQSYYFFFEIEDENVLKKYADTGYIICNFGNDEIPLYNKELISSNNSNIVSLYDYYNFKLSTYVQLESTQLYKNSNLLTIEFNLVEKESYMEFVFFISFTIDNNKDDNTQLNTLFNTYNTISDIKEKNQSLIPNKTNLDIQELIKNDNNTRQE